MWSSKPVQSTSSGSRANPTKPSNLQHLSPFASHSSAPQPSASPSILSPRSGSELPSGVRYIRQTPTPVNRPITARPIPSTVTKRRERSPEKNLRFAEPVQCTRKHEKADKKSDQTTVPITRPNARTRSTSRERTKLVRPVISAEPSPTECKRFSGQTTNHKVVATSPATQQTSPIFSTVNFGGDCNHNSKKSSTVEQNPKSRDKDVLDGICHLSAVANANSILDKPQDRPKDKPNDSQPNRPQDISLDRQPLIKTEISTPNATVLKRSSGVTSKVVNNGAVHRNTVSFPIQSSNDLKLDQNRLSVNVNVAVGLDCSDNRMSRFSDQRYNNRLDTDYNEVNQSEDEFDWADSYGKGFAMQVAVRMRPFVQTEVDSKNNIPVIEMNGNTVRVINSDNDNYNRMEYGFDVCLNSSDRDLFDFADQSTVFKRMGEPLLERALEGYNVCLFAYGQTGSGKSYTITGSEHNPGIIPRFAHELYKRIASLKEVLFAVEVSYYEIYNEKIYDLLSDDKDYNKKILRIREHPQTGPYVENLTQHTVETYDQVIHLLKGGNRRRATASTAANADSSRSHSILTIILSQLKNNSDEIGFDMSCSCGSRINLIDLAGSERVGHSGTSGDRLREGSLINKSLLNLGKVISKLADYSGNRLRAAHIPYRDSALTWLLKESLGGNSQTSMIATISPAKCHLEETLSTIRYAAKARQIVNFVHINEDPKTKKIRELMEIIAELRANQRIEGIDSRDKESTTSDNSKNTSDESKNCSFDSIKSEEKRIETKSIATNTSLIMDRQTITEGKHISIQTVPEEKKKKKEMTSIAVNTTFNKPSKTCGTATDPVKSPQLVSTSTEMSFIEIESVDTSTNTSFVELPSRFDLMRFKKLEEQEKQLLEDIRRHKEKLLTDLNRKVEDWGVLGSGRSANSDDPISGSDNVSIDAYYDAEDVIENESIKSDNTYVISEDTVDNKRTGSYIVNETVKQSSGKHSNKKKDKKKNKDKSDVNERQTEDTNKDHNWSNRLQQIQEVEEEKQSSPAKQVDNYDEWGQEDTTTALHKDKESNDWSVDRNTKQPESSVTQTDANEEGVNDWTTDVNDNKNDEQNTEWGTEGDTNSGSQQKEETKSEDNENQWSKEPKKAEDKRTSGTKSNKKDKNKKKKKKTEDRANEDNEADNWDNQTSEQNKNDNQWGDWGTDSADKTEDKPEEDANQSNDTQFDWGTEPTDTTVIDANIKTESTEDWNGSENW